MFKSSKALLALYILSVLSALPDHQTTLYEWKLMNFNGVPVDIPVITDMMSLVFSLAVTLISALVVMFSAHYMSHDKFPRRYIFLLNMFILSMNCLIFIPSMFILLLGWDGLGLTSYILVIYYQNSKSLAAGMITIMTNRVGDVAILVALASSETWSPLLTVLPPAVALLIAGMTKSAQFPFTSWLPSAMAAPTPVSALVHSSTLVTAGVYFLIRLAAPLLQSTESSSSLLASASITSLLAGAAAIYEYDLKKVIAFSTLSQLGFMMASLGLGAMMLAYYHLLIHAIFKATLFICVGNFMHSSASAQDLRMMNKLTRVRPSMTTFCSSKMALCAAPFTAGFYSKDLILENALANQASLLTSTLMALSAAMTGAYTIRTLNHLAKYMKISPKISMNTALPSAASAWALGLLSVMAGYMVIFLSADKLSLYPYSLLLLPLILGLAATSKNMKMLNPTMWFTTFLTSQPLVELTSKSSILAIHSTEHAWMEAFGPGGLARAFSTARLKLASIQLNYSTLLLIASMALLLTTLLP
uniref:NADH-ubiquinone oxidoreductase chain 5 n=1 Tax=Spathoderma clenchi TaxID=1638910 RepID=A0A343YND2_9MOLL|nr:NADH dehydrogenase subunit 5 [Spathoderma clenchi]